MTKYLHKKSTFSKNLTRSQLLTLILSEVLTYLLAPDDIYVLILNDQTKQYINHAKEVFIL